MPLSYEEIKRILRKIEFDKTEPKLLTELVNKAIEIGDKEIRRINKMRQKSERLFNFLRDKDILIMLKPNVVLMDFLRKVAVGAVDGSFQVLSGSGGQWFAFFGVSMILAKNGFTVNPEVNVDGIIETIKCVDEAEAKRISSEIMMWSETKALRRLCEKMIGHNESYILIDGPIVDPPLLKDPSYINFRTSTIKFCINNNISVIGFVKRIIRNEFIKFLQLNFGEQLDLASFSSDIDLLSGILHQALSQFGYPVYTKPIHLLDFLEKSDPTYEIYSLYENNGIKIYHSYYKPTLRSKIYRIELASISTLTDNELKEVFDRILSLIRYIWTLPGMNEPLPIILAHEKCNIRQGAAEKLYYEVITRSLTEEEAYLWL
jgi:hypothetical protein